MEFMKVIVPGREGQDIDVLINWEKNGMVGETLILRREIIMVSVDLPGAEEKEVNLRNTTPNHPIVVEIQA